MPASMMMAPAGFMWNVNGSSIATVAGGPRPGSTPTTVPRNTPTKHHSRLVGSSATPKPWARPESISTLEPQQPHGQRDAQREREHEVEAQSARDGHGGRDLERAPVHHGDDEEAEQPEAHGEPEHVEQRDRCGEGKPYDGCAAHALPGKRRPAAPEPRAHARGHQGQRQD